MERVRIKVRALRRGIFFRGGVEVGGRGGAGWELGLRG